MEKEMIDYGLGKVMAQVGITEMAWFVCSSVAEAPNNEARAGFMARMIAGLTELAKDYEAANETFLANLAKKN